MHSSIPLSVSLSIYLSIYLSSCRVACLCIRCIRNTGASAPRLLWLWVNLGAVLAPSKKPEALTLSSKPSTGLDVWETMHGEKNKKPSTIPWMFSKPKFPDARDQELTAAVQVLQAISNSVEQKHSGGSALGISGVKSLPGPPSALL